MKGKYLKKIGGFVLAALMLSGTAFVSSNTAQAQGRRVIVRPNPYRIYRPFGHWNRFDVFGYDRWGYDRFGRDRWGNYAEVYRSGFSKGYQDGYRLGVSERTERAG